MERKPQAPWQLVSLGRRSGGPTPYDLLAIGHRLRSSVCSLAMALISLKLPDALDAELAAQARLRRLSKSELMRRALKAYLQAADSTEAQPAPSAFNRVADLVGCCEGGSPDLSSNSAHLAGFGERPAQSQRHPSPLGARAVPPPAATLFQL
jgi:hypothetical protein